MCCFADTPLQTMSLYETAIVTTCTGMVILILGACFIFDTALIIAGNILVTFGFALLFKEKTFSLFKLDKIQGTSLFVLGMAILFFKYALLGVLFELIGLFIIFKNSLPAFRSILYRLFIGRVYTIRK